MVSTPRAITPHVDLSLVLFYYMLKFIKLYIKGKKIVVKATVHYESTVYANNDEVKQTVKQMINNLITL